MKEIKRISVTDSVVESIKSSILSGEYAPGDKLPTENSMCQEMGVSRTCVREAVRVLQAIGYVDILPGKGAFVSSKIGEGDQLWYEIPDAQFYDFMEVRMAIETLSTRLAIKRADRKQIQKLAEINNSFIEAVNEKNQIQLIMYDELFHTEIVKITGNKLLIAINKQIVTSGKKYRGESFMDNSVYKNAVIPHTKILEAFQSNDPEKGQAEMYNHLQITVNDMKQIYERSVK
ncbi:MAG TPA: FadR family transcriptional regulator [Clostridiales bacterium]|nr:FadR family transcriptional regulator [Clostridiales bacterium]